MENCKTDHKNSPINHTASVTNIFLIYSPLHYLAAENIATHFERNSRNHLFYLKAEYSDLVETSNWESVDFLPWPRFYPEKGLFGRLKRTRKNLDIVAGACRGATEIRLHTPVIDTEAANYLINFLQSLYPDARFCVRIIPDGLLNVQRYPLSRLKEVLQYCKKARRLIDPALDYYTFRGDRVGSDAEIVDRIYVLPGLPHEYNRAKTVEISLIKKNQVHVTDLATEKTKRRALVIGQPLVAFNRFNRNDMQAVSLGIREFIAACGIDYIDYKSHPRDKEKEFGHPDYTELVIEKPLETHLASNHYDLVIGVDSTSLLTARMILPASCRVVSYGMDMIIYRGTEDKTKIGSPFVSLGVEMVNYQKS